MENGCGPDTPNNETAFNSQFENGEFYGILNHFLNKMGLSIEKFFNGVKVIRKSLIF
jgi:hypothetical protein